MPSSSFQPRSRAGPARSSSRTRRSRSASPRSPRSRARWAARSRSRLCGTLALRDVLFGRKKLAGPARDRLFALATAAVTMNVELGLRSAGAAGICFKPVSAGDFVRAENELQELLDRVAVECGARL